MTKSWKQAKNILVIRADNMGDLLMSVPAIHALKQTFSSRITVLTSSMAAPVVPFIPEINDVIVFDLPWVKTRDVTANNKVFALVKKLKERRFDAAVIFTVFSQNAMPAAMIAYLAGIPLRLAYCRENPYNLLTDWFPDKEPYTFIRHQVERDLALVNLVGAATDNVHLRLNLSIEARKEADNKLISAGIDIKRPWLIFHAAVSEKKREYPAELWVEAAKKLIAEKGFQILFTGTITEKDLCERLVRETGEGSISTAGLFNLEEFIAIIEKSPIVVSVNTSTIHIAAAVNTPVVVLYAQTNPQHTPWMVSCKILEFEVDKQCRSKNQVIEFLYTEVYKTKTPTPSALDISNAVNSLLQKHS